MAPSLSVKVACGEDNRRFGVSLPITLAALTRKVEDTFALQPDSFVLRGNSGSVLLRTDADLEALLAAARQQNPPLLRLRVVTDEEASRTRSAPANWVVVDSAPEPVPEAEEPEEPKQPHPSPGAQPQFQFLSLDDLRQLLPDLVQDVAARVTPAATPAATRAETPRQAGPEHSNIICDGCNKRIFGVRYKCAQCDDFDLCEACEAKDEHNILHLFVKIRRPLCLRRGRLLPDLESFPVGRNCQERCCFPRQEQPAATAAEAAAEPCCAQQHDETDSSDDNDSDSEPEVIDHRDCEEDEVVAEEEEQEQEQEEEELEELEEVIVALAEPVAEPEPQPVARQPIPVARPPAVKWDVQVNVTATHTPPCRLTVNVTNAGPVDLPTGCSLRRVVDGAVMSHIASLPVGASQSVSVEPPRQLEVWQVVDHAGHCIGSSFVATPVAVDAHVFPDYGLATANAPAAVVAEPEPEPVAAPEPEPEQPRVEEPVDPVLERMHEMGFFNDELIRTLAQKHNGNLERMLHELLN